MRLAICDDMDTINNYVQLAHTIIKMVAKDYVSATIKLREDPKNWRSEKRRNECLDFFYSKRFEIYSLGADPERFVRELDEMARQGKRIVNTLAAKNTLPRGIDDEYTMSGEDYAKYSRQP